MEERCKSRIYDLINLKEWEVKVSLLTTVIFLVLFFYIDFYHEFTDYQEILLSIIECLIGALIGLLGFALSGIAIIVSLFSKKEIRVINALNRKGVVSEVLSSYVFLAENAAAQSVVLMILLFLISSNLPLATELLFYVLLLLETYHIFFVVFYTVALVKNCIKLYDIKNVYDELGGADKAQDNMVNKIKVEFVLSTLGNICKCSNKEVIDALIEYVEKSEVENKDRIIKYIEKQYDMK